MLGTLTAVPIKVPQVSSLYRLAGRAPTVLPQVRPKTQIPDSLPHSPFQEQQSSQPLSLQRATALVSPKSQGPALPTANSTFSPKRLPNGQGGDSSPPPPPPPLPPQLQALSVGGGVSPSTAPPPAAATSTGPGVAYAIVSASPPAGAGAAGNGLSGAGEALKVQPLLFGADNKVIIIQPQTPSSLQGSPGPQVDSPSQETMPTPSPPARKKDEDPEKIAFMVALGLVTTEHMEELQTKRQERKRRSTANPAYSGMFEPERKRLTSNYLNNPLFLSARDTEDLCWKEDLEHEDHCAICQEDGELQPCHNCTRAYHPDCLQPPLRTPPRGAWYCPKCQKKVLNKENMSWPQNFVQSYVTHKTVREEEKRRLLKRNSELKKDCSHLEEQDKRLSKSLTKCMERRECLMSQQRDTQSSLERLKALIRLIQRDQMIQVTMTATTTTGASLLSLPSLPPWIKPTSAATTSPPAGPSMLLQKSLPQTQTQGNN
ncbi:PHD finger protein 21B [Osmerus eperlanus]|uniref:PHD finger protein 21B n=1 Tax=Osmerus eperlanus TaxID=29151 RepID=UPI002E1636D4